MARAREGLVVWVYVLQVAEITDKWRATKCKNCFYESPNTLLGKGRLPSYARRAMSSSATGEATSQAMLATTIVAPILLQIHCMRFPVFTWAVN